MLKRLIGSSSRLISLQSNAYTTAAMGKLDGKVAVVTASTEGIGRAIAHRLAKDGAHVVISSRKQKNVDKTLAEFKAENLSVSGMVCHVGKSSHRRELIFSTVQDHGGIDILVSNAGISPYFGPMLEIPEPAYDKLFDLNVKAGFMLCKEAVPHMRNRGGGAIVFVASIAGYMPMPLISTYSVTKTTLLGMTKALSVSLAPDNIRVNCLAPGIIKTKFSGPALADDNIRVNCLAPGTIDTKFSGMLTSSGEEGTSLIALKRYGKPEECSGAVSFLVSDDASYITGETIVVAGGMPSHL